jgi:predicted DNA-binding transcriptional regulator YafY
VSETTSRVLQLLGLLQSRRVWTGDELAERLAVTTRSVRRDVERLRDLGYPVHASKGHGGGYQLGAGAALPPLLLDPDEAVAMAVCLRLAAGGSVAGVGESALRALSKLDQVMPARLRVAGGRRARRDGDTAVELLGLTRRARSVDDAGAGVPRPRARHDRLR